MNKLFFIIISILFLIVPSMGIELNRSTTLQNVVYENETVESIQLNITDTLISVKIDNTIRQFPTTIIYALKDKNNNTLKISYVYTINYGIIFHTVTRTVTAEHNLIRLNFTTTGGITTNIIQQYATTQIFSKNYFMSQEFILDNSILLIPSMFKTDAEGGNSEILFFFPNKLEIPVESNNYENTYITVSYSKITKALTLASIELTYSNLNPVFKFIFLVFKTGLKLIDVLSLGTVFTDADLLNYQTYLLQPLSILNMFINSIFDIIAFIIAMGIVAIFVIIECILFIFTYSTNRGSMLTIISLTVSKSISVWAVIIIKPILWIYDNLLLRVLGR